MAVRYIEYKGEKLPLKSGFMCLRDFEAETGKNLLKLEEDLTMQEMEAFFYHAYTCGCLATRDIGFKAKYTREQAGEIMEEVFVDFYALVIPLIQDLVAPYKKKLEAMAKKAQQPKARKTSSKS